LSLVTVEVLAVSWGIIGIDCKNGSKSIGNGSLLSPPICIRKSHTARSFRGVLNLMDVNGYTKGISAMFVEGRIVDPKEAYFNSWSPAEVIPVLSENDVHFGEGFLSASLEKLFHNIGYHWVSLITSLGAQVELLHVESSLDFPQQINRVVPFEVNGEVNVIGTKNETVRAIARQAVPEIPASGAEIVFEYLMRRFMTTLSKSWVGGTNTTCFYIPVERASQVEIVGVVNLLLNIDKEEHSIWIGLGPASTALVDATWKEHVAKTGSGVSSQIDGQPEVSLELPEISIESERVIDFLKDGTLIDLGIPFSGRILLRSGGHIIAYGNLFQHDGNFASRIVRDVNTQTSSIPPEGHLLITVEIARTKLAPGTFADGALVGKVILSKDEVKPTAKLLIGGEEVARADIGLSGDQILLRVIR